MNTETRLQAATELLAPWTQETLHPRAQPAGCDHRAG